MSAQPLDTRTLTTLVTAATAAPSLHNAQPWRFRWLSADGTFELHPDLSRAMPRTDPDNRALHLGCGAALLNLRVAVAHAGWGTDTALLPDPEDPHVLATVRLTDAEGPHDELAQLFPAIDRRHTSRYPFEDMPVPAEIQSVLRDAARREGAQLLFPGPWHVNILLDDVLDAEGRDTLAPERLKDIRHWTRLGTESADVAVDGVTESAFGPRKRGGRAPVRDFAGRRQVPGRTSAVFETTPNLALLGTTDDRPGDWLRAGQAMERVLLLATLSGLATSLTSHALEHKDLRELARDPKSAMGFVQMVLRLGYGPAGPGTPRRPVSDVLEIV
ncbi:Acg family FMN-binding oxidoreductase [Streptomyces blattellae]|uniref:Acg family FMN-binding oxidoreductase n=1 Tax=Streptomyces blattellae TaxID=2569855 RepID=UPI0012B7FF20|nr:nitroreductase family protein [Streptomyces blattellae]